MVCLSALVSVLLLSLALLQMAAAAGSIVLDPTTQAPGGEVTVTGSSFGATNAVGIGFGQEVVVTGEDHTPTGTGTGPYTATTDHYPIKPGSFSMHSDVEGTGSDWTDNGDGTLTSSSSYSAGGNINYVTGEFSRSSTADLSTYVILFTASYTYYQYNATPDAGVTTDGAGAFTAAINVPAVTDGTYAVTAVDTVGNMATSNLVVSADAVPDVWSMSGMLLVSTVAVVLGASYVRRRKNGKLMS